MDCLSFYSFSFGHCIICPSFWRLLFIPLISSNMRYRRGCDRMVGGFTITSMSFPHSRLITGCVTRLTWQVPLVEQELLTLLEHLCSPPVFSGIRVTRLVLYVCFVDHCLCFCTFSVDHRVVCSSDSDSPFGIFKLVFCNQFLSPIRLRVRTPFMAKCTHTTLCDKGFQWLVAVLWFSLGTPVSSTNKTDPNDILI